MTEETGAAAPTDGQAAQSAPAESEQATPKAGDQQAAAPENAETSETEQPKPEGQEEADDKPTKLTRNQRLQRKAARLASMVAEQQAELESLRKKANATSEIANSDEPKEADYNGDYTSYLADRAAWKAAQKIGQQLAERDERSTAKQRLEAQQEAAEEFLERAEELKTHVADYDATLEAFVKSGGTFAPHVIEELQESDKGPMLAYQIAKNPHLAAQLNQMSPRDAAREIGRLEAKASLPQPKKQTQAPPPLKAISGGSASPKDVADLAKNDLSAYIKQRNAEDAANRR